MTSLPLAAISPDPSQPRKRFDRAALDELAGSIASAGILEPIIVRSAGDAYVIVAGERRWRAAAIAGLTEIPAIVRDDLADRDVFVVQMIENVIRADMDPVEEAHGYARLIDAGLEPAEIAKRIGVSLTAVHYRLALLRLDTPILKLVADGQLSVRDGWLMARLTTEGQHRVVRAMVAGSLTRAGDVARMVETVHRDENQSALFAEADLPPAVNAAATKSASAKLAQARAALSAIVEALDELAVDDRMVEEALDLKRAAGQVADRLAARRVALAVEQTAYAA